MISGQYDAVLGRIDQTLIAVANLNSVRIAL
jgi:hypothetical protein